MEEKEEKCGNEIDLLSVLHDHIEKGKNECRQNKVTKGDKYYIFNCKKLIIVEILNENQASCFFNGRNYKFKFNRYEKYSSGHSTFYILLDGNADVEITITNSKIVSWI